MSSPFNILVVEDEQAIRDVIRIALPKNFHMIAAENTEKAKKKLQKESPHLILLDWMLPGCSGIDFMSWLKNHNSYKKIPIIMLTARAEEDNKIKGLLSGADDYITKPFSTGELVARIKTILRRSTQTPAESTFITYQNILINQAKNEVTIDNNVVMLTTNEYKLLCLFMKNPNKTFTREQLINKVWGYHAHVDERSVDMQIKRLREKLKPFDYQKVIKTIRGIGYQFES